MSDYSDICRKEHAFSIDLPFYIYQKSVGPVRMGPFLDFQSRFTDPSIIPLLAPYCFDHCIFVVSLKIRRYEFFVLFQNYFGYSNSFAFNRSTNKS